MCVMNDKSEKLISTLKQRWCSLFKKKTKFRKRKIVGATSFVLTLKQYTQSQFAVFQIISRTTRVAALIGSHRQTRTHYAFDHIKKHIKSIIQFVYTYICMIYKLGKHRLDIIVLSIIVHLSFVPVCIRLWMLRVDFCVKRFIHTSHSKGRSPVWVRKCISRYGLQVNAAGHCMHWYGRPCTLHHQHD